MMCPSIPGEYVGEISRPVVDTVRVVHERSRGLQHMIPARIFELIFSQRHCPSIRACAWDRRARMDGRAAARKSAQISQLGSSAATLSIFHEPPAPCELLADWSHPHIPREL